MLLAVGGLVENADFLESLRSVEAGLANKTAQPDASRPEHDRPFSVPPAPLTESRSETVSFPAADESMGTVTIGWRGPEYDQHGEWEALKILWKYLTATSVSPLQAAMVETESPVCGHISAVSESFSRGYHQVWFSDARTETLSEIPALFFATVEQAASSIDMERMGDVITQARRKYLSRMETAPSDEIHEALIRHHLYGARDCSPEEEMDGLQVRSVLPPLSTSSPCAALTPPPSPPSLP